MCHSKMGGCARFGPEADYLSALLRRTVRTPTAPYTPTQFNEILGEVGVWFNLWAEDRG